MNLMTDLKFAFRSLEAGGVFTATGKQRAAVQTLMKAIAQRHEIAKSLGLKRQPRGVARSMSEIVASVRAGQS